RIGAYTLIGWPNAGVNGYFSGSIDEVRFSSTLRSADWIMTEFNNHAHTGPTDPFLTVEGQESTNGLPTVAKPTFSQNSSTQTVSISSATANATIHYTINGPAPTPSTGLTFNANSPIQLSNGTTTIQAIAFKQNMNDSLVASATY